MAEPQIPEPNGCRHCGISARSHYQQWTVEARWHAHVQPTDRQRLDRMKARRAARIVARQPRPATPELDVTLTCDISGFQGAIRAAATSLNAYAEEAAR